VLNFANVNMAIAMRDEQSVSPITPKRLMMVLKGNNAGCIEIAVYA
jgi:hypothetical protein